MSLAQGSSHNEEESSRLKFYAPTVLGPKTRETPEGYLVCEDVQIARIGELIYVAGEIEATNGQEQLEAGRDGLIRVNREEAEVFNPVSMASFLGKPVTIEHPDDDVTPENWRSLAVGVVFNVRRGDGELSDFLLADFLIQEAAGITAIRSGKREVSCGYDADYEAVEPGRARQTNILGNHVALVDKGRCGPRCAVRDSKPNHSQEKKMAKRTVFDRIRTAFKANDEAAFEEEMENAMKANDDGEDTPQRLVIEVKQAKADEPEAKTADDEEETGAAGGTDPMAAITAALEAICARLDKLEAGATSTADDAEEVEEEDDEDTKSKTGDSASLQSEFTDTVARAEILAPGVKLPTFDAKADKNKTSDGLCALRRKAMTAAFKDDAKRAHFKPFLTTDSPDFTTMSCDAVKLIFNGASELAKIGNNSAKITHDTGARKTLSNEIADINKRNAEFWSQSRK